MSLLLWGLAIGTLGKVILGVAVLRVHVGILHEHRIDGAVLESIKREQVITLIGLGLIILGFVLEVVFYSGSTELLSCDGENCAAAIQHAFDR